MRICIVTDAWVPQVNGVVRTLQAVIGELEALGHEVLVIAPDAFRCVPCPSYPEIRLALAGRGAVGARIEAFRPDALHIATEGPLGMAARRHALRRGQPFTTAYHTQFPAYLSRRTHLPEGAFWPFIQRFHRPSQGIMVATRSVADALRARGLTQLRDWSRGVDLDLFGPHHVAPDLFFGLQRPIQLYVGRVSVEKNVEAFLRTSQPGSKVVIGDGPALSKLRARFPHAHFLGRQTGEALAQCYTGADVLVFPSVTDTFGLVMIESLASGTPVAAFPVSGPRDVLTEGSGAMDDCLDTAIAKALTLPRADCLAHGRSFSWRRSAMQFLAALEPAAETAPGLPPAAIRAA